MSKKPVVLMILDGYGLNDNCDHNAVLRRQNSGYGPADESVPFVKAMPAVLPWTSRRTDGKFRGWPFKTWEPAASFIRN